MERGMEEAKTWAQQQQMMLMKQQQQQHHPHQQNQSQQFSVLLQQQKLQQQRQQQHQQQQSQQQQAIARFPSNIDAHLRTPGLLHRPIVLQNQQHHQNSNSNPNPNRSLNPSSIFIQQQMQLQKQQSPLTQQQQQQQQTPSSSQQQLQPQPHQLQKPVRPGNSLELQMAYQDAWRVCHPDFKRPFSSLEDACERLLPYHVVADYEAEEDDRILELDPTGSVASRSQQWDHNISVKVAEFTATFEKQALAFNIISHKRAQGEFRSEERLMIEQALVQEEKRAMMEARAEIASRQRMAAAAMAHAERARAMAPTPIRGSGAAGGGGEEGVINTDEMIDGWGSRDEREPSDDFLNDEENTENGETEAVVRDNEWRQVVGEFDLNTR